MALPLEENIILAHLLHCHPIDIVINKPTLTQEQNLQFQSLIKRLADGKPLQYILGQWDFFGLSFELNASVLVPRPETEMMVEQAISFLSKFQTAHVLDLGTGSGNIAVTIAKFCPHVSVVGVDLNCEALQVAQSNADHHGIKDRMTCVKENILSEDIFKDQKNVFDLIISNPPYIPTNDIKHLPLSVQAQPLTALDGGTNGLIFFDKIIKISTRLLRNDGCLMMEFGDGQAQDVKQACLPFFNTIQIHQDLTSRDRFVIAGDT